MHRLRIAWGWSVGVFGHRCDDLQREGLVPAGHLRLSSRQTLLGIVDLDCEFECNAVDMRCFGLEDLLDLALELIPLPNGRPRSHIYGNHFAMSMRCRPNETERLTFQSVVEGHIESASMSWEWKGESGHLRIVLISARIVYEACIRVGVRRRTRANGHSNGMIAANSFPRRPPRLQISTLSSYFHTTHVLTGAKVKSDRGERCNPFH